MKRLLAVLCLAAVVSQASSWEKDVQALVKAIRSKYGSGQHPRVSKQLAQMEARDQKVRTRWLKVRGKAGEDEIQREMEETDQALTNELKELVEKFGWPTFEVAGYAGSEAALLILSHSPDHDYQRKMLPELSQMAEEGRIMGEKLALIIDKLLISEGKPQRFGTQFSFRDGKLEMDPVEDLEHLEELRSKYALMPLEEYRRGLEKVYKTKVE
jgi:hypothetical protein